MGRAPNAYAVFERDLLEAEPELEVFLLLPDLRHSNHQFLKDFGRRIEIVVIGVLLCKLLLIKHDFLFEDVPVRDVALTEQLIGYVFIVGDVGIKAWY